MVMRTYKFKLEPTVEQQQKIDWTIDLCRFLYNSALEQRIFAYEKRGISVTYNKQQNELPQLKKELPEFKQIHSQVLQDVLKRLDKAYESFFKRVKRGEKAGFPRFQGKNRYDSFTYTQSGFSIIGEKKQYLRLSKIGAVRVKCHRQPEGKIKTCCIKRKNGKYYVSLSCEVNVLSKQPTFDMKKAVGIDLGISHLAITSDKDFHENHKFLQKSERQLKKLQRTVSRRKKGSQRRKKAVRLLAKKHEQIANQRKDNAHNVSRKLVEKYDFIAFEDLNIQGMVKNERFAKGIADSAWRQLIQFTTYKAEYAGKRVVFVNPYNTTQMCSSCGTIVKKTVEVRIHRCPCGYVEDRDVNAAKNILHLALQAENLQIA